MDLNEVKKENIFVRNLGVIKFPRHKLTLQDIEFRKEIFSIITPLMAYTSNNYFGFDYDYFVCYHPLFRELEDGLTYPEYEITVKREEDKLSIMKVKEIDKNNIIL